MKNLRPCIVVFLMLTFLTGVVYPLAVTAVSQLFFRDKANGSLLIIGEDTRGSLLIGQKFENPAYFRSRPSMTDYSAMPSGASNQGPTSEALRQAVEDRKNELTRSIPGQIPPDLLLASGSGLDPHISPDAAFAQIDHVAKARSLSPEQKTGLTELVKRCIEEPQWGIFGAPRVNVLRLNLAADGLFGTPVSEGAQEQ